MSLLHDLFHYLPLLFLCIIHNKLGFTLITLVICSFFKLIFAM